MITDLNIFVDPGKCLACGLCVDRCIMDNLRLLVAPCRMACPLKINCQGYIRNIAQGKFEEAALELNKDTPFADILGLICHRPCETVCKRTVENGEAVPIKGLKYFLAKNFPEQAFFYTSPKELSGKKISIVGSGPAGLMAAWDLAMAGHKVDIYEQDRNPGGMLNWAIPAFRMPREVLTRAIIALENLGVKFILKTSVQKDKIKELLQQYDAVLLALGSGPPKKLGIPGEGINGIYDFKQVLAAHKAGNPLALGEEVIVVGGGNAAVDAAICARMSGATKVSVYCLEEFGQMPAFKDELDLAQEKGIRFENCWGPKTIFRDREKLTIEFAQCFAVFNDQRDFCPQFDFDNKSETKADSIIIAIGQEPQTNLGSVAVLSNFNKRFQQNKIEKKLFIAGDMLTGPSSVVDAMATGKNAADSVHRFVSGIPQGWDRSSFEDTLAPENEAIHPILKERFLDQEQNDQSANLPPHLLDQIEKAQKCLACGRAVEFNMTCWTCLPCEIECPTQALSVKMPFLIK